MRDPATNYTFQWPYAQALTPVAANGFEPAVLVGGWDATVPVCLQVQGFTYGGNGALPSGFYIACRKTVSFRAPPATGRIAD